MIRRMLAVFVAACLTLVAMPPGASAATDSVHRDSTGTAEQIHFAETRAGASREMIVVKRSFRGTGMDFLDTPPIVNADADFGSVTYGATEGAGDAHWKVANFLVDMNTGQVVASRLITMDAMANDHTSMSITDNGVMSLSGTISNLDETFTPDPGFEAAMTASSTSSSECAKAGDYQSSILVAADVAPCDVAVGAICSGAAGAVCTVACLAFTGLAGSIGCGVVCSIIGSVPCAYAVDDICG